jgi:glycosyltransferase involved in cell wall biosynthesis
MKVTLSYSGGTARGQQLARELDRRGWLHEFHQPSARTLKYGEIGPERLVTNPAVVLFQALLARTRRLRRAKPTQRFWACEATDRFVARRLKPGADMMLAESHIALSSIIRARELGMIAAIDRTNSHIEYQSQVWGEENRRFGLEWVPNSRRVIEKGLREYEEADFIFVLSSYVEKTFLDRGVPAEKLVKVPSGIDLAPFRPLPKEDKIFRVIFCGAIQNKKGVHYLLEAFHGLNLPNAEIWLIGTVFDDLRPVLEKYAGKYRLLGYLPSAELAHYYSQGSIFVLPSLEEGLAKVMLEAMACGLPVVATTNTGGADVIRHGTDGFIVPIRDVAALQKTIAYFYENPEQCQAMGQNALARVHAEFTIEKYFQRLTAAVQRIVAMRTTTALGTQSNQC